MNVDGRLSPIHGYASLWPKTNGVKPGHELGRRVAVLVAHARLTDEQASRIRQAIESLVDGRVIDVIPRAVYEHMEETARRRVPRDLDDWPPVALALSLKVGILTGDNDFLGCGCPTWTVDTLSEELGQR